MPSAASHDQKSASTGVEQMAHDTFEIVTRVKSRRWDDCIVTFANTSTLIFSNRYHCSLGLRKSWSDSDSFWSFHHTVFPSFPNHTSSRAVVSIQAPEPIQLRPNCIVGEVLCGDRLRSESWLHGIYEHCRFIVSPLRQIRDIERD
jgi:hypothetical protein